MDASYTGYGPVVDLVKDDKNTELVSAVRPPPYPSICRRHTNGRAWILTVLEYRKNRLCCLPRSCVSTPCFSNIVLEKLTRGYPSGFVHAKDSHGKPIFEGKRLTALSNAEEDVHGHTLEVSRGVSAFWRECILTSRTSSGHRSLLGGQDR